MSHNQRQFKWHSCEHLRRNPVGLIHYVPYCAHPDNGTNYPIKGSLPYEVKHNEGAYYSFAVLNANPEPYLLEKQKEGIYMEQDCKQSTSSPEEEHAFETLDNTLQAKKARETSIATSADSQRPTLRDQLAMAALPGLIAEYPGINKLPLTLAQHTHNAYVCADEMLEARKS
ncbi:MAG: hypothetical protein PF440_06970, partial [Thiomicrorhabdus sp.]|nr:hypothetical protein [Thiomicrorhabdus sp.]